MPLYPPVALNPTSNEWVLTANSINAQGVKLNDFMTYTGYGEANPKNGQYDPSLSKSGSPFSFIPKHCAAGTSSSGKTGRGDELFDSPIVAVIRENNDIE